MKYLQVIFVPGPKEGLREEMLDYEEVVNIDQRHWRYYHLLLPIIRLLPACKGVTLCAKREEAIRWFNTCVKYYYPNNYDPFFPTAHQPREGIVERNIQCLHATKQSLIYVKHWLNLHAKGRKVVTITLRAYDYMPDRNSNLDDWVKFANYLDPEEFFLVFIPDTHIALEDPIPLVSQHTYFYLASWNVEIRAALYELSYLNMGINNGPMAICCLNEKCRYLMFKIISSSVPQSTPETIEKNGYILGKNPVFANRFQKWVWEDDNIETLIREFFQMHYLIEASQAERAALA